MIPFREVGLWNARPRPRPRVPFSFFPSFFFGGLSTMALSVWSMDYGPMELLTAHQVTVTATTGAVSFPPMEQSTMWSYFALSDSHP